MKAGRKPKHEYEDKVLLIQIEGWAMDRLSDKQIAEKLGITPKALCQVKKKFSELTEALKRGRAPKEVLVENSLFKRAIGMTVVTTSTEERLEYNPKTKQKEMVTYITVTTEEIPPEVKAINIWLRNRKAQKWNAVRRMATVTPDGEKPAPAVPQLILNSDLLTPKEVQLAIQEALNL